MDIPSAQVDKVFQKMDSTHSPGCALSVMKDGRIIYERGYGMADLDHDVPITPATVFHVASMSKQFTAASIVMPKTEQGSDQDEVKLTPEQLKSKVGTYLDRENDDVIRIGLKDNKLRADRGSSEESYELKALGENHFCLTVAPVDLTFDSPNEVGPLRLIEKQGDQKPIFFTRVPDFTPTAAQLGNYAEVYSSVEIDPLYELKLEGGGLVLHRLKNKSDPLHPVAQDLFVASVGTIRFTRGAEGEVSGFLLSTGRIRNFRFRRGRPAI